MVNDSTHLTLARSLVGQRWVDKRCTGQAKGGVRGLGAGREVATLAGGRTFMSKGS